MSFLVCACGFFFLISRAAEKGWQATNGPAGLKFGHPWPHAMYPFSKSNVAMEHKSLSTTSQSPAVISLALFIYFMTASLDFLLACSYSVHVATWAHQIYEWKLFFLGGRQEMRSSRCNGESPTTISTFLYNILYIRFAPNCIGWRHS